MGAEEYYGKGYSPAKDDEGNDVKPEHYVSYLVSAYPDYADGGQYITQIEITDPKVAVYGITVNSTEEQFRDVFTELGYTLSKREYTGRYDVIAEKDGISYYYSKEIQTGKTMLTITAEVTNRDNIQF